MTETSRKLTLLELTRLTPMQLSEAIFEEFAPLKEMEAGDILGNILSITKVIQSAANKSDLPTEAIQEVIDFTSTLSPLDIHLDNREVAFTYMRCQAIFNYLNHSLDRRQRVLQSFAMACLKPFVSVTATTVASTDDAFSLIDFTTIPHELLVQITGGGLALVRFSLTSKSLKSHLTTAFQHPAVLDRIAEDYVDQCVFDVGLEGFYPVPCMSLVYPVLKDTFQVIYSHVIAPSDNHFYATPFFRPFQCRLLIYLASTLPRRLAATFELMNVVMAQVSKDLSISIPIDENSVDGDMLNNLPSDYPRVEEFEFRLRYRQFYATQFDSIIDSPYPTDSREYPLSLEDYWTYMCEKSELSLEEMYRHLTQWFRSTDVNSPLFQALRAHPAVLHRLLLARWKQPSIGIDFYYYALLACLDDSFLEHCSIDAMLLKLIEKVQVEDIPVTFHYGLFLAILFTCVSVHINKQRGIEMNGNDGDDGDFGLLPITWHFLFSRVVLDCCGGDSVNVTPQFIVTEVLSKFPEHILLSLIDNLACIMPAEYTFKLNRGPYYNDCIYNSNTMVLVLRAFCEYIANHRHILHCLTVPHRVAIYLLQCTHTMEKRNKAELGIIVDLFCLAAQTQEAAIAARRTMFDLVVRGKDILLLAKIAIATQKTRKLANACRQILASSLVDHIRVVWVSCIDTIYLAHFDVAWAPILADSDVRLKTWKFIYRHFDNRSSNGITLLPEELDLVDILHFLDKLSTHWAKPSVKMNAFCVDALPSAEVLASYPKTNFLHIAIPHYEQFFSRKRGLSEYWTCVNDDDDAQKVVEERPRKHQKTNESSNETRKSIQ